MSITLMFALIVVLTALLAATRTQKEYAMMRIPMLVALVATLLLPSISLAQNLNGCLLACGGDGDCEEACTTKFAAPANTVAPATTPTPNPTPHNPPLPRKCKEGEERRGDVCVPKAIVPTQESCEKEGKDLKDGACVDKPPRPTQALCEKEGKDLKDGKCVDKPQQLTQAACEKQGMNLRGGKCVPKRTFAQSTAAECEKRGMDLKDGICVPKAVASVAPIAPTDSTCNDPCGWWKGLLIASFVMSLLALGFLVILYFRKGSKAEIDNLKNAMKKLVDTTKKEIESLQTQITDAKTTAEGAAASATDAKTTAEGAAASAKVEADLVIAAMGDLEGKNFLTREYLDSELEHFKAVSLQIILAEREINQHHLFRENAKDDKNNQEEKNELRIAIYEELLALREFEFNIVDSTNGTELAKFTEAEKLHEASKTKPIPE